MSPLSVPVPRAGIQQYLEYAVPLSSFGFTLIGILLWQAGIRIPVQYFAAGCVISSCILAFLAFIRPRKDIVALSTPLYAFIFFVVPTDYESGIILQILYGISITILLVRLKYRFGSCAAPVGCSLESGPLFEYEQRIRTFFPTVDPSLAEDAASVFSRFAEGEYRAAGRIAGRRRDLSADPSADPVSAAFAIIAEYVSHMDSDRSPPCSVVTFSPTQQQYLFHAPESGDSPEESSEIAVDNALLLLYALAQNSPDGNARLSAARQFAHRISVKS